MERAKTFFYAAAGVFLLMFSFHLGARQAESQSGREIVGVSDWGLQEALFLVVAKNGDCVWLQPPSMGYQADAVHFNIWEYAESEMSKDK